MNKIFAFSVAALVAVGIVITALVLTGALPEPGAQNGRSGVIAGPEIVERRAMAGHQLDGGER